MYESDNQGPVYCGRLRCSCIFRLYTFLDLREIRQNREKLQTQHNILTEQQNERSVRFYYCSRQQRLVYIT